MHLFITGNPGAGKTTLMRALIQEPEIVKQIKGFYTPQIREDEQRTGFKIVTIDGKEAVFAHKDFKTPFKVSRYCVDIDIFNKLALPSIKKAQATGGYLIIDEIGKMELFSEEFKTAVEEALEKNTVIATIPSKCEDEFLKKIKAFAGCIIELRKENFPQVLYLTKLFLEVREVGKIRELEDRAKQIGLEERILIENASSNLASVIDELNIGRRGLVVAGRGNNGADVLSCARKLLNRDYEIEIALVYDKEVTEEVNFQLSILKKIKKNIYFLRDRQDLVVLKKLLKDREFVLEGILGIGVKGAPNQFVREIIEIINQSKKPVFACDIPSGLSPDEGVVSPYTIKATHTVTFIAPKKGFFLNGGLDFCGRIHLVDIGISRKILENLN